MEREESDHLRDLESRASEIAGAHGDAESSTEDEASVIDEERPVGDDSDYGVENDMRPGGEAPGEHDADEPTKSISEDVTGDEETENMSDIASDD